jgi:hypothetical protein
MSLGHIGEFERQNLHVRFKSKNEEHAAVMPRHARHERSVGLKEKFELRVFPGELFWFLSPWTCGSPSELQTVLFLFSLSAISNYPL